MPCVAVSLAVVPNSDVQPVDIAAFPAGDSTGQFSGVVNCFTQTFRKEGLLAFYNGFGPNFARLGSWNVVMFLTVEQVKKLFIPKDAL